MLSIGCQPIRFVILSIQRIQPVYGVSTLFKINHYIMQDRDRRISELAQQIDQLSSELRELLTLQESSPREENRPSTADQTPPDTAFLVQQLTRPLEVGDTVQLIGSRDRLQGEQGRIVKITAQQYAIELFNYPNNPRRTNRYKEKVERVLNVAHYTSQ